MSEKKVSFLNKQMPIPLFAALTAIMAFLYFAIQALGCYDTDMYFFIATGQKIREIGFFDQQLWTIDRPSGFVVQQWLWDVLISAACDVGVWTLPIISFVQACLFMFVVYKLFRIRSFPVAGSVLASVTMTLFSGVYLFTIRPQCVTLILVLLSCYALEKFRQTEKILWLGVLPLLMVIEVNVHISMWFMHIAVVLAYMCPAFYYKKSKSDDLFKHKKSVGIAIICMVLSMFINPYGVDGILYSFRAIGSNTFELISIVEMKSVSFYSLSGVSVLFILAAMLALGKKGVLHSTSANMILGISALMVFKFRFIMFVSLPLIFVLFDAYELIKPKIEKINWKKDVKWSIFALATPVILYTAAMFASMVNITAHMSISETTGTSNELEPIMTYFDEHGVDKHTHIFTGVDSGAYLEVMGYDNIYFDSRPETFSKAVTKDKDIVGDMYMYAISGSKADDRSLIKKLFVPASTAMDYTDTSAMINWLETYDFEYVIAEYSTSYLRGFMDATDLYERVDCDSGEYRLYKRK